MALALIHGKILKKDGSLHPDYQARLDVALGLTVRGAISSVLLSGGVTRAKYRSEAAVGEEYLKRSGMACPIFLEESSVTTKGNILACLSHIRETSGAVFVICSSSSLERVRFLYGLYAQEQYKKLIFVSAKSTFIPLEFIMNFPFLFL